MKSVTVHVEKMTYTDIHAALWDKRQDAFIQTSKALDVNDIVAAEYWTGAASAYHEALELLNSLEEEG
jgi:hypothetical protein